MIRSLSVERDPDKNNALEGLTMVPVRSDKTPGKRGLVTVTYRSVLAASSQEPSVDAPQIMTMNDRKMGRYVKRPSSFGNTKETVPLYLKRSVSARKVNNDKSTKPSTKDLAGMKAGGENIYHELYNSLSLVSKLVEESLDGLLSFPDVPFLAQASSCSDDNNSITEEAY